jgi:cell division protein YceG involved in septum cleavage
MRLQCDATVQYARERAKPPANWKAAMNRACCFPYSRCRKVALQYLRDQGLAAGPICNPGEVSLFAVRAPKASPYFYYVMSPAQGKHRFSVDYAGHLRNVRLYKQELRQQ